jgi:cytoskeleton protein RodZ
MAGGGVAYALSQSDSPGGPSTAAVGVQTTVGVTPPTALLLPSPTSSGSPSGSATSPTRVTPRRRTAPKHAAVAHPDTLRLHITGAASYVAVSRHGRLIEQTILHHGQRQVFRRHGLDVVLGDAGAVTMSVNGHGAHRAGSSGEVRRFSVR